MTSYPQDKFEGNSTPESKTVPRFLVAVVEKDPECGPAN